MMNDLAHRDFKPVVFERNGEVFANSRDVAVAFGKNHRDVMRAIDTLIEQEPDLRVRNFAQTSIRSEMPNGGVREDRAYDMDRDGFTLLAMGFTGAKALKWKLRYIDAFNSLEEEVKSRTRDPIQVLNDPAAMRGLLLTYSEKVITLEEKVKEQAPTVEAYERIAGTEGTFCITDAAKTLQVPPRELFRWLRANRWIYTRPGTNFEVAYQDRLNACYLEHKTNSVYRTDGSEKTVTQIRVTAKGLAKLAKELKVTARSA